MFINELDFAIEDKKALTGDKQSFFSDTPLDATFEQVHINGKLYYYSEDYQPKEEKLKVEKRKN